MGFDGLFFGRIDFQDHIQRAQTKRMEMIWKGSSNLGEQSWLFTGVIPRTYNAPDSFCFDYSCDDEPIKVCRYSFIYLILFIIHRMIHTYMIIMYQNEFKHLLMQHIIKLVLDIYNSDMEPVRIF